MIALLLVIVSIFAMGVYDMGSRDAGYYRQAAEAELTELRAETAMQKTELEHLRREIGGNDSNAQMAQAAQERLIQQVKDLEAENNRLREDLAVFERLAKERPRSIPMNGRH